MAFLAAVMFGVMTYSLFMEGRWLTALVPGFFFVLCVIAQLRHWYRLWTQSAGDSDDG